jgi:hypothetical protein
MQTFKIQFKYAIISQFFVYYDTRLFPVDITMIQKSEERHKLDGGVATLIKKKL